MPTRNYASELEPGARHQLLGLPDPYTNPPSLAAISAAWRRRWLLNCRSPFASPVAGLRPSRTAQSVSLKWPKLASANSWPATAVSAISRSAPSLQSLDTRRRSGAVDPARGCPHQWAPALMTHRLGGCLRSCRDHQRCAGCHTCHCPSGESLEGTQVWPDTAFATQAGQGNQDICSQFPVAGPIPAPGTDMAGPQR
jgi:hypothetical protein